MAGDDKKTASKTTAKEKAPAAEKTPAPAAGKAEAKSESKPEAKPEAKPEGAAPSNYSRGEGQKPVSQAYKDNWNAIYGKKNKKKKK